MNLRIVALGLMALASSALAAPKPLTKVKVFFIEALDPKDTTSSQRFQQEYESAISKGKELTVSQLKECGFEITSTTFFTALAIPSRQRNKPSAPRKKVHG
jgi:hypothetical protein